MKVKTFVFVMMWVSLLFTVVIWAGQWSGGFTYHAEPAKLPVPHVRKPPSNIESRLYNLLLFLQNGKGGHIERYVYEHALDPFVKKGWIDIVFEMSWNMGSASPVGVESDRALHMDGTLDISKRIQAFFKKIGARVDAWHDRRVKAKIPVTYLTSLTSMPEIDMIRFPRRPLPMSVISEGVEKVGALPWQKIAPYRSQGRVRIGVLDVGFRGYKALLGKELPPRVLYKKYSEQKGAEQHGTGCAEILYDMYPQAELVFVAVNNDVDHARAVDFLIEQKVDVISNSMGWVLEGPGDGTGYIDEDVKRAVQNGILWVAAAGNLQRHHWEGMFEDPEKNGWHNFTRTSEILEFFVPAGKTFCIYLDWKDWGRWDGFTFAGSGNDYDLYLWKWENGEWSIVDESVNVQNGSQLPIEWICRRSLSDSAYGIGIYTRNALRKKLEIFVEGGQYLEHVVPEGSLLIPADSIDTVAVGATDWATDELHWYSSLGPTEDGRPKPDMTAPSGVQNVTYGTFFGTSAATPHVAGAVALMKAKTPFTVYALRDILYGRALDLGAPGFDIFYGRGRLFMGYPSLP